MCLRQVREKLLIIEIGHSPSFHGHDLFQNFRFVASKCGLRCFCLADQFVWIWYDVYGGRFVKLVVYINHKSLPGPKVQTGQYISYIYIVDKSKCLLYSCKIEKPHTLCNVCNVQCFKTILWWSASFQSTRNRGNLPYDYETAIFRNHSPRVSPKSFSQSQRPPGPTSSKWLETCCQLTANCRQDCGAKTDALGEWRGSTKFSGELLGEKTPKRTTEATWKTWLIGWLYNCLS